jgi:hypothetical protein
MNIRNTLPLIALATLSLNGCSFFTPPAGIDQITENGNYLLNFNAERRSGMFSIQGNKISNMCFEPVPDIGVNYDTELSVKEQVAEVTAKFGQGVVVLPGRNSTVLALRESLYRLCELSINEPTIPPDKILDSYNKVIFAITQYAAKDSNPKAVSEIEDKISMAKQAELNGFKNLVEGKYEDAYENFLRADSYYPTLHNCFEIKNALKSSGLKNTKRSNAKISDDERKFLNKVVGDWKWGAPDKEVKEIKKLLGE